MNDIDRLNDFAVYVAEGRGRGLTRRQFLRRGLALGLSLNAIGAVLAGCGAAPLGQIPPGGQALPTAHVQLPASAPNTAPAAAAATTIAPAPTPTLQPSPTPAPATRIAVIGDYGWAGPDAARVAEQVAGWQPDFVVTTGDNNYPVGDYATLEVNVGQYYRAFMAPEGAIDPAASRFFPVIGNHDTEVDNGVPYLNYFLLPGNKRYYSVERPPVRVFAVNSVPWIEPDGADPESAQAAWLRQELAATPDLWKVVVFHHPPYSSGHRGEHPWMRWPFREWGADVVLNGHHHAYERIMRDGFAYLTNGLGGGPRYAWAPTVVEGSTVRYNADYGAMLVEATPSEIVFQFVVASTGEVIDRYALQKSAG